MRRQGSHRARMAKAMEGFMVSYWLGAVGLFIVAVRAPSLGQTPSTESSVEAALKVWVPCLHAGAKRAKTSGLPAEAAVEAAYKECGTGDVALNNAVTALETNKRFSEPERAELIQGVRLKIRQQVMAGVSDLPTFSFRELVAGPNFEMSSPEFKKCDKKPNTIVCTELFDRVAGVPAITSYTIYNRKLAQFWISTERDNLPTLLLAFTQKYGKPCKTDVKEVQNRLGNSFKSTELTWCFRTGKMVASEIGTKITQSSVIYNDEVNAEPAAPTPVDF